MFKEQCADGDKGQEIVRPKKFLMIGVILSVIYLLAFLLAIYFLFSRNGLKINGMELNQIGDFLAGVFAPLAFVWIVVGYLQQSEELSLQVKELNAAVHQQAQMVKAAREQIDLEKSSRAQTLILLTSADLPYFEPDQAITTPERSLVGYNFLLSFVNRGEFASEVNISLKVGEGSISNSTHSNIPQGQAIQFFLQTSEKLITDGWEHVITIISLSAMKRPRVQEFALGGEQFPISQVSYPAYK